MRSEWRECSLDDVAELTGGYAFKSSQYQANGVFVLRTLNISDGGSISQDDAVFVSDTDAREFSRFQLCEKDILFVMVGATLGKIGKVSKSVLPALLNQNMWRIRARRDLADQDFLYYSFKESVLEIIGWASGSARGFLRRDDCRNLKINLPPVEEQKAIAQILGTLDDKIELNRKTNETLEAMARALFQSWFVDFDPVRAKAEGRPTGLPDEISDLFPDSFEESELGEIPRGWQCCAFTQLVDVISGGTPKTSIDEYWNGVIPWFSVVDAPAGPDSWVIQTEKSITSGGLDNCSSKLLQVGTTIISARGTVGKVCLVGQDMAINQSCYGLRSKSAGGDYFCFYLTKSLVEILEARAHGSVFSTITRDTLDGVSTIYPPLKAVQAFNAIAGGFLGKIKGNLNESLVLRSQRDTLLPKLISGELRIPEAEKLLEQAGV
jgi:type I restriction enzyme S subunit